MERALEAIRAGKAVALVTDSGMPGISDPGSRVVAACRGAGFPVTAIPGPTAVATAVALSGMGGRGYLFEGFLPHKSGAHKRRLGELAADEHPVVLFESPYRLLKLSTEIEEVMGPRRVFVGRELTKQFEECLEGTPAEVRAPGGAHEPFHSQVPTFRVWVESTAQRAANTHHPVVGRPL